LLDRWAVDRVFEPMIGEAEREIRYAVWRLAVDRSRDWAS
jgi:glycerol kinase